MEFRVERPDCRLYCEERGRGPLLLLIHGVACDSGYFSRAAKILAADYRVVTYDRRGYSRSVAADTADYSAGVQAEDAACIIRQMDCGPAFVAGCSAGAILVGMLCLRHPELVRMAVMHEPIFADVPGTEEERGNFLGEIHACRENGRISLAMETFIGAMGGVDTRASKKSLKDQAQDLENMRVFVCREADSMLGFSARDAAEIAVPAVVLAGECDRGGLFRRAAEEGAGLAGLPVLVAPGFHNLAQDLPEEYAVFLAGIFALEDAEVLKSVRRLRPDQNPCDFM